MAGPAAASQQQLQMLVTRFERLTRRISLSGLMSGHKAQEAIAAGRVLVDGRVVSSNFKVFSEASVAVDGRAVPPPRPRPRLWATFKPRRVLCQDAEKEDVETLRSLFRKRYARELKLNGQALSIGLEEETLHNKHFVIVTGLPFTADGLVLLTNDGLFADALTRAESRILTMFDIKIAGDAPVDLLHSWRRNAHVGGINYGQVFTSITKRTGAATRLRLRYVETSQRPIDLLLERAKMRVIAIQRHAFGPYSVGDIPPDRCVEVPVHKSMTHLCPQADMRQVLLPTRGALISEDGRLRAAGLEHSAVAAARPGAEAEA